MQNRMKSCSSWPWQCLQSEGLGPGLILLLIFHSSLKTSRGTKQISLIGQWWWEGFEPGMPSSLRSPSFGMCVITAECRVPRGPRMGYWDSESWRHKVSNLGARSCLLHWQRSTELALRPPLFIHLHAGTWLLAASHFPHVPGWWVSELALKMTTECLGCCYACPRPGVPNLWAWTGTGLWPVRNWDTQQEGVAGKQAKLCQRSQGWHHHLSAASGLRH